MSIVGAGYEFTVENAGVVKDVYPVNYRSCSIRKEEQDNLIFLRTKFSGSLLFINDASNGIDDFNYFFNIDRNTNTRCNELEIKIYNNGILCYTGYFSVNKGSFDVDNCKFIVTPETDDKYRDIFDKWNEEVNIIGKTLAVTVQSPNIVFPTAPYTRCMWMLDIIEYLCQQLIPSATISSDFFTFATDCVTLDTNKNLNIAIAQKSDIVTPSSSEPATIAMLSFSQMMDILRIMFNVYWDYDEVENEFIIEHISFFETTTIVNTRTDALTIGKNKYSYESMKIPWREVFHFMESHYDDFVGMPIEYSGGCVSTEPTERVVEYSIPVTTDIEWIENTDKDVSISSEGFVLLATEDVGGVWTIMSQVGYLSYSAKINASLSWANLHLNYQRHNRDLINGLINGLTMVFCSSKRLIKQVEISIGNCDCPPEYAKYKTELGDEYLGGEYGYPSVIDVTFNGLTKLNLKYGEPENPNEGVVNPYIIGFGMFSRVETADPMSYCNNEGGCGEEYWGYAYQNWATLVMYWDAAGTIPINTTGVHMYYMNGCNVIPGTEGDLEPTYGFVGWWELNELSALVEYHLCDAPH
jgi:hypothetical protein